MTATPDCTKRIFKREDVKGIIDETVTASELEMTLYTEKELTLSLPA